jgi:hypothetical protein
MFCRKLLIKTMLSKEVVTEIFIAGAHRDAEGHILPAPVSAIAIRDALKDQWDGGGLKPNERAMVSLGPTVKDGVEGFSVRKEIVHKSSP